MQFLIFIHAFFAFGTLIMGPLVFLQYNRKVWESSLIWFYLIAHFLTAITGLFFGNIAEISPFKILALITIINFGITAFRLQQKNYAKARTTMFPAYVGLCIAFIGTLHPERILGHRFFIQGFKIDSTLATNIWILMMISSVITAIIVAITSFKTNIKLRL